jgi:hypothetical protein
MASSDCLTALRAAIAFDGDLSVNEPDADERVFLRHAKNPQSRRRVYAHETPAEVAASLRGSQGKSAPTRDELAAADRRERLEVRRRAIEQLRSLEEAQQRGIDLDAALGERARGERVPASVQRGPSRERRPTTRRRTSRALASRDGPDESEPPLGRLSVTPPRTCAVCGDPLTGRYSNAVTCKGACRQKAYRQRKKSAELLEPSPDLWRRYDAALGIVDTLHRFEERLDLLARPSRCRRVAFKRGACSRTPRRERVRDRRSRMTAVELLRDVLARVAWIRESYEPFEREQALEDLEFDLAGWLATNEKAEAA